MVKVFLLIFLHQNTGLRDSSYARNNTASRNVLVAYAGALDLCTFFPVGTHARFSSSPNSPERGV